MSAPAVGLDGERWFLGIMDALHRHLDAARVPDDQVTSFVNGALWGMAAAIAFQRDGTAARLEEGFELLVTAFEDMCGEVEA